MTSQVVTTITVTVSRTKDIDSRGSNNGSSKTVKSKDSENKGSDTYSYLDSSMTTTMTPP
jgi:hypothetical protein